MKGASASGNDPEYWWKVQREAPLAAIEKCEEAAKQLITLNALLITLYSGIVSFNDVLKKTFEARSLLFAAPVFLLLVSLVLATRVIVPRRYIVEKDDPDEVLDSEEIQQRYEEISRKKLSWLSLSHGFLIISMFVVLLLIIVYLMWVPPSSVS